MGRRAADDRPLLLAVRSLGQFPDAMAAARALVASRHPAIRRVVAGRCLRTIYARLRPWSLLVTSPPTDPYALLDSRALLALELARAVLADPGAAPALKAAAHTLLARIEAFVAACAETRRIRGYS